MRLIPTFLGDDEGIRSDTFGHRKPGETLKINCRDCSNPEDDTKSVSASCGKNAENHIFVHIYVYFKSPVLWQFSCQVRGSSMHLRHRYKCTTNLHFRFGPNWI